MTWWTNLEHYKQNEELLLYRRYYGNEKTYPEYDNYKAINVDRLAEIPKDYFGPMEVPITFIGHWNKEQFDVLGILGSGYMNESLLKDNCKPGVPL